MTDDNTSAHSSDPSPNQLTTLDLLHIHLMLTRAYRGAMADGHLQEANEIADRMAAIRQRLNAAAHRENASRQAAC
jgi:hypothetical protein